MRTLCSMWRCTRNAESTIARSEHARMRRTSKIEGRKRRQRRGGNQRAREPESTCRRTLGPRATPPHARRRSATHPLPQALTHLRCTHAGRRRDVEGLKTLGSQLITLTSLLLLSGSSLAMTTEQLKEELKTCLDRECRTRLACKRRCHENQDLALHRARESIKKHKKPTTIKKHIQLLKAHDVKRAEELLTPGIIDAVQRFTKPVTAVNSHHDHHHHHHE